MEKYKSWVLPIIVFSVMFVVLSVMLMLPPEANNPPAKIVEAGTTNTIPQNGQEPVKNGNFSTGDIAVSYCHIENYNRPTSLNITWELPDGSKETDSLAVTRNDYYYSAVELSSAGTYVATWEISEQNPVKVTINVK